MKKILLLLVVLMSFMSCRKPYMKPKFYDTKANEIIFLVPMEEAIEDQGNFNNVKDKSYYDKALVMTTRVNIRQRYESTGRAAWRARIIDLDKLIVVDKTPVSRTWTADASTGTKAKNQGFNMESKDSIAFTIGGVCTARITDASLFLATYGEGASLSTIMDENIRTTFDKELNEGFAKYDLTQGRANKNDISKTASKVTIDLFEKRGITIDTLGLTGGMVYDDEQIQKNINDEFASKLLTEVKKNERLAQDEVNKQILAAAETKKQAAYKFASTAELQQKMVALEVEKLKAEAQVLKAKGWDGHYPEKMMLMPADSGSTVFIGDN